jgi:hypothetical protein
VVVLVADTVLVPVGLVVVVVVAGKSDGLELDGVVVVVAIIVLLAAAASPPQIDD